MRTISYTNDTQTLTAIWDMKHQDSENFDWPGPRAFDGFLKMLEDPQFGAQSHMPTLGEVWLAANEPPALNTGVAIDNEVSLPDNTPHVESEG